MEPEMEDVLRALGARRLDIHLKVGISRPLPYFFGSLKVAITLAFAGSVEAERSPANKDIGHLMLPPGRASRCPWVFAGLLALAVLGSAMYAAFAALGKR
jgi:NitT/TauT family transport system permease protein